MEKEKYVAHSREIINLVEGMTFSQWEKVRKTIDDVYASLMPQVEFKTPDTIETLMKQNFIH